jgi:trehalose-6-phosphate synthase
VPGRELRLQALPIGIASDDLLGCLDESETQAKVERLRAQYKGRKVIIAVDRVDYTKGLPERLRTFRRMLNGNPELIGKVVLLQIAAPSRENIESYQALRDEVHELISDLDGQFGTPDWVPVVYIHRSMSRPELVVLYRFADVAWVSPLRDGMNLVAKEYVVCHPEDNGALVLSGFAGAAAEMGEALLVNPFDEERTASTVVRALAMSNEEKRDRMLVLHERVIRNNVFSWVTAFSRSLTKVSRSVVSTHRNLAWRGLQTRAFRDRPGDGSRRRIWGERSRGSQCRCCPEIKEEVSAAARTREELSLRRLPAKNSVDVSIIRRRYNAPGEFVFASWLRGS